MNNTLWLLLKILILTVIFFLIALIVYLFYCNCYPRRGALGEPGRDLQHASAEPHTVTGGKYPTFTPKDDPADRNNDRARKVPTGPLRGNLSPSQGSSQLLQIKNNNSGGAAGDPVVFSDFDPLGTQSGPTLTPPDMSAARAGEVLMLSFNTNVLLSTNGTTNYSLMNPTNIFPSGPTNDAAGNPLDRGLCCDQVIQYVPKIDRFVWLMQFCGTGAGCLNGINRVRIASASPQQIISSGGTSWTYWDLLSGTFNLGTTTMDYPDLAVGDDFLYFSADAVGTGLLVVRIPLSEIQNSQTINMGYTNPSDGGVAYGGHVSQNTGNEVFWAGHNSNSQLRVFSMREDSNQYFQHDVNVNSWPNGTISSIAKDGTTDWLNFLGTSFPGNAVLGLARRGDEVWLAWTASQGGGFTRAHVQIAQINTTNYTVASQWQIWNNDYAFAFPSLATNSNNEAGISLAWGGNQDWGNHAVGMLGDFIVWYPELSDTAITRWGDYVSVRRNAPNPLMYDASGYAVFKQTPPATGIRFDPYYIQFGRNSVVNPTAPIK
ncbi:MAG: hypothetical protein LC785_01945 [Acidobacteria bacterium]|nr:hypothetical protein [Acidobacteriota bacterium]MCA1632406.1 hypothetical protein [Acidobacteriota bacterium]MCA1640748.1 hypothetical protein [Acidobacteriota bacterium]